MTLAPYIHAMGRGPGRARSLELTEAQDAMRLILSGTADPHAIGALLMLMRYRGETPSEIAGFALAIRATLPVLPQADLDWPSYAAGRTRGLPWFLLSAKLIAQSGVRVLLHGWNSHKSDGADVRSALALVGIEQADSVDAAARLLDHDSIAYLPLDVFAPRVLDLLRLRDVLGLRSCINTVCRVLNPALAPAVVQGVFHPPYRPLQQAAGAMLGQQGLCILKGGGGEFERNPSKDVTLYRLQAGQTLETTLPPLVADARKLADTLTTPDALGALWAGTLQDDFAQAIVIGTAAAGLIALGHSPEPAQALAQPLLGQPPPHPQTPACRKERDAMKTFPMFLQMAGRHVVIVGGGEQAAQKARLMLKTEARLVLVAPELDPELATLVAEGRAEQVTTLSVDVFRSAALVFIATGCVGYDYAAHALAKNAGVVVNVVDRPALCDATTPSIVDRDPVVVAISTEGTAPVLARQIKSKMETLLEPALGELAALAGRLRPEVNHRIPQRERRFFWDWVFNGPARQAMARGAAREAAKLVKDTLAAGGTGPVQGAIALVGAGPGAADLLTLRALRLLQEADVIYYDRLVYPAVLELARRDAERVFVGKEVGASSWPQDRINAVIVAAAKQGRKVVRLKSGDPGIFGRLTEELDAAREAGIPVEIVPGVTAASAAAASLGRGLTERGATDRLMLATAACKPGDPDPDWAAMLRPGTSLAVYMGVRQAEKIVHALRAATVPMSLQVEVISKASTSDEQITRCTLSGLPQMLAEQQIDNPAVMFIRWPKDVSAALPAFVAA